MKVSAMDKKGDNLQKAPHQPAIKSVPQHRHARVLVVDDDEKLCYFVNLMLTHGGYSVVLAHSGRDAVSLYRSAQATGTPFDMVILDMTIPHDIGGVQTFKELQSIDPFVKAIISSGYADDPVMLNAATYGFKSVLTKPFTAKALWTAMREASK